MSNPDPYYTTDCQCQTSAPDLGSIPIPESVVESTRTEVRLESVALLLLGDEGNNFEPRFISHIAAGDAALVTLTVNGKRTHLFTYLN